MTGFYRDGCCNTGREDIGSHTVCVLITSAFLEFSKSRGNDLSTPVPEFGFSGLKPGDRWCLCAGRWQESLDATKRPGWSCVLPTMAPWSIARLPISNASQWIWRNHVETHGVSGSALEKIHRTSENSRSRTYTQCSSLTRLLSLAIPTPSVGDPTTIREVRFRCCGRLLHRHVSAIKVGAVKAPTIRRS